MLEYAQQSGKSCVRLRCANRTYNLYHVCYRERFIKNHNGRLLARSSHSPYSDECQLCGVSGNDKPYLGLLYRAILSHSTPRKNPQGQALQLT